MHDTSTVAIIARRKLGQLMRRYATVSTSVANAPTAPASVGVAMPARITPSVARITTVTGNAPISSSRSTSGSGRRSDIGSAGPSDGFSRHLTSV